MKAILAVLTLSILCGCSRQTKLQGSWDLHFHDAAFGDVTNVLLLSETNGIITGFVLTDPHVNWPAAGLAFPLKGERVGDELNIAYEIFAISPDGSDWASEDRNYTLHAAIKPDGLVGTSSLQSKIIYGDRPTRFTTNTWQFMGLHNAALPRGPFYFMALDPNTGLPAGDILSRKPKKLLATIDPNTGFPINPNK